MPRVRLENGEARDEIRQYLYDSLIIDAAEDPTGDRSFFTNVQGKAKYLTNMRQNGQLEAAVSFRCMGMGVNCQNIYYANKGALPLIMEHSYFQLRVGEKIYWEGNGADLVGRIDEETSVSTGTGTAGNLTTTYQKFGDVAVQSLMFGGAHVIDIPPLQSFAVAWQVSGLSAAEITLSTPAADTRLQFTAKLQGLLRRPVQ